MLKAAIFDFDGLLLDTETPEFESWSQVFAEQGAQLQLSEWTQFVGTWIEDRIYTMLEERVSHRVDRKQIRARHNVIYQEQLQTLDFCPGVRTLIPALRQAGLMVAIASNSDAEWVAGHLAQRNFRHHFNVVTTGNEVERMKPDPELYRLSLARLDIAPAEAVVFEDSLPGVCAGLEAGITVFAIPTPVTRHLTYPPAARRLNSLADVTVPFLQALKSAHDS